MRFAGVVVSLVPSVVGACTIATGDAQTDLVLTRSDGTLVAMPPNTETFAYCETYDAPTHTQSAIKVFHGNRVDGASWLVWAVRNDVTRDQIITFPVSFTSREPARGALVFVNDDADDNEVASDQPDSEGTITFDTVDCNGFVDFTIRASLASEVGGPPILVRGSFRAPVGEPPD